MLNSGRYFFFERLINLVFTMNSDKYDSDSNFPTGYDRQTKLLWSRGEK
jgi:hypothetical protein